MTNKIKIPPFLFGIGIGLMVLAVTLIITDGELKLKPSKAATSYVYYWMPQNFFYDGFGYILGVNQWRAYGTAPSGRYFDETWSIYNGNYYVIKSLGAGSQTGPCSPTCCNCWNASQAYCSCQPGWITWYLGFTIPYGYQISGTLY